MTTAVQRRRGTNTEHASFTGLEGEISVNTTNESVHVHDGSTAGGFELMRADGSNSSVSLGDITGVTAGTGLSGGGTSGDVTLNIDGTVATLAGTQTFTNKTLTSPILNTPTIGTSFTIGGATITEAELEILDGATVTTTELNYVDGVTSSIQTQIDAKAPIASPTFTGTVTIPTADINAGSIDGTAIGASSASTGAFTTLTATGLTVDTDTLYVDSTNNRVGIGTSSPSVKLHIVNGASSDVITQVYGGGTIYSGVGVDGTGVILTAGSSGSADSTMRFQTASNGTEAERLRIDSSGNVGIGTSSPSTFQSYANSLVVGTGVGGEGITVYSGTLDYGALVFADGTSGNSQLRAGQVVYDHGTNSMFFNTNASEAMRIDSSGRLLVGTTSTTLYASGTGGATGVMLDPNGPTAVARDSGTVVYLNRLTSDGEIVVFRKNGSTVGSISTNANSLPSDRNFKRNIQNLTLGLDFVESLNPVTYNFKIDDEGQAVMTGLIAQEVEEALTAAGVEKNSMTLLQHKPTEDASESDYQMDYLKFVPILINSIKEQQTLIESLTARIAALEE